MSNQQDVNNAWIIGILIEDKGWMCEGIFLSEEDAIANCKEEEFLALVKTEERLPEDVSDIECIYWPHQQTKEEGIKNLEDFRAGN